MCACIQPGITSCNQSLSQIWGFDIMLDDDLRAWLLEANTCPSLAADSPLDKQVKTRMVADALHLLGPVPYDADVYETHAAAQRQARLTGLPSQQPMAPGLERQDEAPRTPMLRRRRSSSCTGQCAASVSRLPAPRHVTDAERLDLRGGRVIIGMIGCPIPQYDMNAQASCHQRICRIQACHPSSCLRWLRRRKLSWRDAWHGSVSSPAWRNPPGLWG
jgi:hypothetical protein